MFRPNWTRSSSAYDPYGRKNSNPYARQNSGWFNDPYLRQNNNPYARQNNYRYHRQNDNSDYSQRLRPRHRTKPVYFTESHHQSAKAQKEALIQRAITSIITIQRCWRNYVKRKKLANAKFNRNSYAIHEIDETPIIPKHLILPHTCPYVLQEIKPLQID
mgnify:CR=1 FL=1